MKAPIVAILSGIATALIIVLGAAAFYFWNENQRLHAALQAAQADQVEMKAGIEQARIRAERNACLNNLRQLDGATQQWALENKKPGDAIPTFAELREFLVGQIVCPAGGQYTLRRVSQTPTCSIPEHTLPH